MEKNIYKKKIIEFFLKNMNFLQKLDKIVKKNNSLVCVGLDSDIDKLPAHIKNKKNPQFLFNKTIVYATHDLICAYKLNSAFYEAQGAKGIEELKLTCNYLKNEYPEIPIILDAKRADIGNTNIGYVKFAFEYLKVDAITIHPYLGEEAVKPFLEYKDKGIIILCKTSNPGAHEFQDLKVKGKPLYKIVAENVTKKWNKNNNCLLVVGATYPKELAEVRKIVGDMTLLIPGIGVQGGDLKASLKAGLNSQKQGLIINSSRGIIFASHEKDFVEKARDETKKLKTTINKLRSF